MDFQAFNEKVMNLASDLGAEQCEVISHTGSSLSLQTAKGEIDQHTVSQTHVCGIRVIKDEKVGYSSTESLTEGNLKHMVTEALNNAVLGIASPYQNISAQGPAITETHQKLYPEDNTPLEAKIDLAIKLEKKVLEFDTRIKNAPYNQYTEGKKKSFYLNHHGTIRESKLKTAVCYTTALSGTAGRESMFFGKSIAHQFKDLDPDHCIYEAAHNSLRLLEAKPIPTGKYDIVFTLDPWSQLFQAFTSVFSGKSIMEGKSNLDQKIGTEIGSSLLNIRDEPKYENGFNHLKFDGEGFETESFALIENGILNGLFHNSETSSYLKAQNTFHGRRSPKSKLGVGPHQLVVGKGLTPENEIKKGPFLEVLTLKGLHSGVNPITGNFSLPAEAIYHDGNEQMVKGITISANFFDLLNQISAIGDIEHPNSDNSFFSPLIRFSEVSVAGC